MENTKKEKRPIGRLIGNKAKPTNIVAITTAQAKGGR